MALLPSLFQMRQLVAAEDEAVNRCLQERNSPADFRTASEPQLLTSFLEGALEDNLKRSDVWGYFNPNTVERFGYHNPTNEPAALESSWSGDEVGVLGDCIESVESRFPLGHRAVAFAGLKSLPDGGPRAAVTSHRFRKAVGEWRSCMHEIGFDYESPVEAATDERWHQTATLSQREMRTAETDAICKSKSDLLRIAFQCQTELDREYIRTHRDQIIEFITNRNSLAESATQR